MVDDLCATVIYQCGLSFNIVNQQCFEVFREAVGRYGRGYVPPSFHRVRKTLLEKQYDNVAQLKNTYLPHWKQYEVTLMIDGWTDRRGRSLLNFLVNCHEGTFFLNSVEASSEEKNADYLVDVIEEHMKLVGVENIDVIDARSSGASSPESTGSIESSISSHFGGMSYPSLFSSRPQQQETRPTQAASKFKDSSVGLSSYGGIGSPIREEYPSYSKSTMQRYESFENPMAGRGTQSSKSLNDDANEKSQVGKALYDFTAGGDDELSLNAGEEVEIDYEVDGWFYVKKKRPGRDGKIAGLVPVLYVSSS